MDRSKKQDRFFVQVTARRGGKDVILASGCHVGLCGIHAASAVLRVLRIFSCPSNRVAIDYELSLLSSASPDSIDPSTWISIDTHVATNTDAVCG